LLERQEPRSEPASEPRLGALGEEPGRQAPWAGRPPEAVRPVAGPRALASGLPKVSALPQAASGALPPVIPERGWALQAGALQVGAPWCEWRSPLWPPGSQTPPDEAPQERPVRRAVWPASSERACPVALPESAELSVR
jgi:hypothetical protein